MEREEMKRYSIALISRIVPLFTLLFTWSGIYGVKQYSGMAYLYRNKILCVIGIVIIFGIIFLKTNWKAKTIINIFGNLLFWVPLFHGAYMETHSLRGLTRGYFVSMVVVLLCVSLQSYILIENKSIN